MSTRGPKNTIWQEGEEGNPEWKKIGDTVKKWKIQKNALFNFEFVELAARLKAAGFSDTDLAYTFNVNKQTVTSWKERYPQFKLACDEGKDIAVKYLVAKGLRAAVGYDYTDYNEKYTTVDVVDEDGKPTGETKEVLKERSVFKKSMAPNPSLLIFMLANLKPDDWQSVHKIQVDKNENINIQIDGKIVSKQIDELAGRLIGKPENVKEISSKTIERNSTK